MRVIDVGDIMEWMEDETSFVLKCEEFFHDKIGKAACEILKERDSRPIVCLTGPSGSGKTTTAMRLRDYLENLGVKVCMLSMDNFFLPLAERPKELTDWESPLCVDRQLLIDSVRALADGKRVALPRYNFKTGERDSFFNMKGSKDAIIIAEGIHMLNPLIFDSLSDCAVGVYVAPRTRIVTKEDKVVRPEQVRIARRMVRDFAGRGHSLRETVLRAKSVDAGEMNYIQPYKHSAAIHIDTFHDYEPCLLAQYIRDIPDVSAQLDTSFILDNDLVELYKLARMLPPLKTHYVPKDSIVREFVGGSKYAY